MTNNRLHRAITTRRFQRLVVVFVVAAAVLVALVVYFAFSRTTITITPHLAQNTVDLQFLIIAPNTTAMQTDDPTLNGTIVSKDVTVTQVGTVSTNATTAQPSKAVGTVTIINNSGKSQTLRETTRLLSDGGVLFRTTKLVVAPARGSVDVGVLADQPGVQGEIAPSKFEIVALWPGLKSQIYGESKNVFTGGTTTEARVTQEDLNAARKDILDKLASEGRVAIEDELLKDPVLAKQDIVALTLGNRTESPGAAVGDTVSNFTYTMTTRVTAVVMDQTVFNDALTAGAEAAVDKDHRFLGFAEDQKKASVRDIDEEKHTATVTVSVPAKTVVRLSSSIFDRSNLVNRDRQEVLSYFSQFDDIAKTSVHFSPFWVFRTPSLPDHIDIKLLDPTSA